GALRHGARPPHLRRDPLPALRAQQRVPEEPVDAVRLHCWPLGGRRPDPAPAPRHAPGAAPAAALTPSSTTTEANALSLVWVRARSQRAMPRRRASAAARPWRTRRGGAPRAGTTSKSRQPTPCAQPVPSAFMAASLAAKRTA